MEQTESRLASTLSKIYAAIDGQDALKTIRKKAWKRFEEVGLPNRKNDLFGYLRLSQLLKQELQSASQVDVDKKWIQEQLIPGCEESHLVFVNGTFSSELSCTSACPKRLVVLPLSDAIRPYGAFLNSRWAKELQEEKDPFALLNAALHPQGALIYLPPSTVLEQPIQIVNVIATDEPGQLIQPRLQVFAGTNTEAQFLFSNHSKTENGYFLNAVLDFALEDGAQVSLQQSQLDLLENAWQFIGIRGSLKRNSRFHTTSFTTGSTSHREDYHIRLAGENAEALLYGAWLLDKKLEAHVNVLMEHQAPHCRSNQVFKGILEDHSHSSFIGKVYVHKEAQKTDAYQLNANLLLSDTARADCQPNLEIFADDVKASHGATVGQLDEDQLFYLLTRGCSRREARNMLLYGYIKEIIEQVHNKPLQAQLESAARAHLILYGAH